MEKKILLRCDNQNAIEVIQMIYLTIMRFYCKTGDEKIKLLNFSSKILNHIPISVTISRISDSLNNLYSKRIYDCQPRSGFSFAS